MTKQTIAVLITCHNRREKTLACLDSLFKSKLPNGYSVKVFLVDDGSTDGTCSAVLKNYPEVEVIHGDGSLYWNRGMFLAFDRAMSVGYDFYLWLNDDVVMYTYALCSLLKKAILESENADIVVGAVCDPDSKEFAYGGSRCVGGKFRPFLFEYVKPDGFMQQIDMMNGNVVLIPRQIANQIGNLNPIFEHAMGDTDYALRAQKAGFKIFSTDIYVGECSLNSKTGTFADSSMSLVARYKSLFSRKGLPLKSWFVLCREHAGIIWPIQFLWGYIKLLFTSR